MKEIIIRRSIYDETKGHKLVETGVEGEWLFVPAEEWMPVYINHQGKKILSLDCDGFGHPLCLGDAVPMGNGQLNKVVKKIYFKHNVGWIVVLEDAN